VGGRKVASGLDVDVTGLGFVPLIGVMMGVVPTERVQDESVKAAIKKQNKARRMA
jgi:hypothetical protein